MNESHVKPHLGQAPCDLDGSIVDGALRLGRLDLHLFSFLLGPRLLSSASIPRSPSCLKRRRLAHPPPRRLPFARLLHPSRPCAHTHSPPDEDVCPYLPPAYSQEVLRVSRGASSRFASIRCPVGHHRPSPPVTVAALPGPPPLLPSGRSPYHLPPSACSGCLTCAPLLRKRPSRPGLLAGWRSTCETPLPPQWWSASGDGTGPISSGPVEVSARHAVLRSCVSMCWAAHLGGRGCCGVGSQAAGPWLACCSTLFLVLMRSCLWSGQVVCSASGHSADYGARGLCHATISLGLGATGHAKAMSVRGLVPCDGGRAMGLRN